MPRKSIPLSLDWKRRSNLQAFMKMLMFLIGFGIVVLVHESGHFFASKLVKFTCEEFAIGMGPKLFVKEYRGTKYQLRAIPFGGSCAFKEFETNYDPGEKVRSFYLKKIFVLLGGPFANVVLAFLILIAAPGNLEGLKVVEVKEEQLISAGIKRGDIIRKINEERVYCVKDIEELLVVGTDNTINLYNERYEKENTSFFCQSTELDIVFEDDFKNRINGTGRIVKEMCIISAQAIKELFTDEENVVDSVTYNPYSEKDRENGVPRNSLREVNRFFANTVTFAFGVGIFNLLPIVYLDGFKIFLALLAVIMNRKFSEDTYILIGIIAIVVSLILIF